MAAVLSMTVGIAGPGKTLTAAQRELRLIQSKDDIENPRIIVEAVPLICSMFTPSAHIHT